eukprot:m.337912 g.337912  ORF g.337912 m.337912 type:complete len:339 (-) comp16533_c3_seq44:482-1498(-)
MTMRSRGRHDVFREFSHHILWMVGVCCVNVAVTGSARPSSGCRQAPNAHLTPTYPVGGSNLTIPVTDALGTINRSAYLVFPPHQRDANLPLPVVVAFHGQSGTGPQTGSGHLWDEYAARDGYVMVYPTGMDDADPNEPGGNTGWNVGTNGDTSTCVDPMPDPTYSVCHTSCVTLKQCGRCSWSTCRDDVKFIGELLDHVAATACIDLDAVHISGASNGGMMALTPSLVLEQVDKPLLTVCVQVHYLGQQMPGRFASINPVFALPLVVLCSRMALQRCHPLRWTRSPGIFGWQQLHSHHRICGRGWHVCSGDPRPARHEHPRCWRRLSIRVRRPTRFFL